VWFDNAAGRTTSRAWPDTALAALKHTVDLEIGRDTTLSWRTMRRATSVPGLRISCMENIRRLRR
jgi:hypothetical protein